MAQGASEGPESAESILSTLRTRDAVCGLIQVSCPYRLEHVFDL